MSEAGRPRIELTPEQIKLVEEKAAEGLTQADIADLLPMSESTFKNRLRDPEDTAIADAYYRGRAWDKSALAARHRDIAMGKLSDVPISEQRKALEWRLERQHKLPSQSEIKGDGIPFIIVEREPDE